MNIDESIETRCDEINAIVRVMNRANATGDDVRQEIHSGLVLISAVVADIAAISKAE